MRPQEVLTIYINNAVKAASRLAVYLFSQVNRPVASLRSIFVAFFCNLSTTFHASDATRRDQLVYFLGFSSALNAFDTQLGLPGCQSAWPCRAAPRSASKSTANMA